MQLTTEENELFIKLEVNRLSLNNLTQSEQILMSETLRPNGAFSTKQRNLIYPNWWLITPDIAALQAKLPAGTGIPGRETLSVSFTQGVGWAADAEGEVLTVISASLLTDCRSGETYGAIGHDLWGLVVAKLPPELFPIPEEVL